MQELEPEDPATIGPYRLSARLGEGGMGRVYLAVSRSGRRLAVKVVRPDIAADPGFRERFRREIEAARAVGGFWTAPIVDADPDAATPWVAGDYIDAPSLGALVDRRGALDERELRAMAAGLAEALEAIHRTGLVHRDLKPSNIMVTADGPRVIDFGISKAAEGATTLTDTGSVIGTPGFMSPEQASGARVGPASDMFALGAVLVFAATGRGPFGAGSVPALLYRVVHDEPSLNGVPEGLRPVVAICLEKDPGRRPTASQLLDLLSGGGTGDPGSVSAARPVPPTAPVTEVEGVSSGPRRGPGRGLGVPAVVDVRTGPPTEDGQTSGGRELGVGLTALVLGTPLAGGFFGWVALLSCLVGSSALIVWGLYRGRNDPPIERVVMLTSDGLTFRLAKVEWQTSWGDVVRITLKPVEQQPGNDVRRWQIVAVLRRGVEVLMPFAHRPVRTGARQVLDFTGEDDMPGALSDLDAGLRCYAGTRYKRHPDLAALVDGPRGGS
ncbi:serine/threonine-protein kinase [Streptomyces lateritius]|uniref:serine/threonine-protein kinase n=1 Tax=Streptomyces lateritius TaxID=67313 RepID=UPI00167B9926|nr:serine/threonine-protein kinase [Streptomyces lateritius]GGU04371.1 hypothetical protein GCM10010272_56980 [Streptomyces lateritius]